MRCNNGLYCSILISSHMKNSDNLSFSFDLLVVLKFSIYLSDFFH